MPETPVPDENSAYLISILRRAKTLQQAEDGLSAIAGMSTPKKWGLFDGFCDRPKCVPGVMHGYTPHEVVRGYEDGFRLGQKLAMAARHHKDK